MDVAIFKYGTQLDRMEDLLGWSVVCGAQAHNLESFEVYQDEYDGPSRFTAERKHQTHLKPTDDLHVRFSHSPESPVKHHHEYHYRPHFECAGRGLSLQLVDTPQRAGGCGGRQS